MTIQDRLAMLKNSPFRSISKYLTISTKKPFTFVKGFGYKLNAYLLALNAFAASISFGTTSNASPTIP